MTTNNAVNDFDYVKLGFKSGLEVHQQLDAGKLFCNCPGLLRSEEPDFSVKRKLHKVAGETGEVDAAVTHEHSIDREFFYQGYHDTNCLIELDEEPPHLLNTMALDESLRIALLLNCEIYPISQIMRKTVIDGSNTSGFQRTVLIGHDGYIETSYGKVEIETIALEEDSARIVDKDEKKATYRLDRLGIPLVEIATTPSIHRPEQIKEAALKLGEILRACKVKRGIGTIRQDINVSIKGHDRVELKGFQDVAMMITSVNNEIKRQGKDIDAGTTEGGVRNVLANGESVFLRPLPGRARMYPETDLPLLKIGREKINLIKKSLPKLRQEIKSELAKKGLSEELINLVLDGNVEEFSVLSKIYTKDANLVAKMVTLWRNEFASKLKKSVEEIKLILNERVLETVLVAFIAGNIGEGDIKHSLLKIASGTSIEEALKVEKVDEHKLEEDIRDIIKEKPGLKSNAYMGVIIQKLGVNVDKRKCMEILARLLGQ